MRHLYKNMLLLVSVLCASSMMLSAQEDVKENVRKDISREEMHIRYVVAKANIERNYMNNAPTLDRIVEWTKEVQNDPMVNILSVEFCGAVSPEGSVPFNHWLSVARLTALEKYVRKRVDIPEDIIVRSDHYIAWDELKEMVLSSDLPNKDEIMEVLNSENTSVGDELDSRIAALKAIDNGRTWRVIFNRYFIHMRNAYMVIVTEKSEKFYEERRSRIVQSMLPVSQVLKHDDGGLLSAAPAVLPALFDQRYMYIKTNFVGLGLLMANLGVEFDLGRYMSLSIPVYYSAVNYFKPTIKFRTLATQPELRYWPMSNNDGLFIGAHMGFAYYNFAFDGDWRYQDKDGTTPTLGGGLSLGYRIPISKNERWKLEFGVGAGIYPLQYDVFHNVPDVKEGELFDTRTKTYIGLDNVHVGISYRIPMKKAIL